MKDSDIKGGKGNSSPPSNLRVIDGGRIKNASRNDLLKEIAESVYYRGEHRVTIDGCTVGLDVSSAMVKIEIRAQTHEERMDLFNILMSVFGERRHRNFQIKLRDEYGH